MRAKEYLREIRRLEIRVRQKKEEIALIREQASCLPSMEIKQDRVQTSPDGQGFTRLIDKAAVLEQELLSDIEELQQVRHERIEMIQQLSDPIFIEILYLRYVSNRSMAYIADYLQKGLQHTYKLHGWALQAFEKQFQEIFQNAKKCEK